MKKTIWVLVYLAALLMSLPAVAEDVVAMDTSDNDTYTLGEIEVTAGTNYQVQEKVTPQRYASSTHMQETAPGFASPFIGAFTGNQVDQVVNDIRTSNALFRTGPNQYYSWIPDAFVSEVRISDGGNVGGTISRDLFVPPTHLGFSYNSPVTGFTESASYKNNIFGMIVNSIDTDNVDTARGTVPNSSYNQRAIMGEFNWNDFNKSVFLYTRSDDIRRTDKWNGGFRSSGFQNPKEYTWELQQYVFANHRFTYGLLDLNLAYQRAEEEIQDDKTQVHTINNIATVNGDIRITDKLSFYATNNVEFIRYDNGKEIPDRVSNDIYATTKQGVRYKGILGPIDLTASIGGKEVSITGFDTMLSPEASVIIGWKGLFFSYDHSTNAPCYAALKQSTTTGKGTSVPNPNLTEEVADTYRIGYMGYGLYLNAYIKHFDNAIVTETVAQDTYKPVNWGTMDIYGGTLGYATASLLNTGVGIETRVEITEGDQSVFKTSDFEPVSKTPLLTSFLKVGYKGVYTEWQYGLPDTRLSSSDINDVRIYGHNHGYSVVNLGYVNSYKNLEYHLVFNNIFDNDGRILGSSADVPGRGFIASLRYFF